MNRLSVTVASKWLSVNAPRVQFIRSKHIRCPSALFWSDEADGYPGNVRLVDAFWQLTNGKLAGPRDVYGVSLECDLFIEDPVSLTSFLIAQRNTLRRRVAVRCPQQG